MHANPLCPKMETKNNPPEINNKTESLNKSKNPSLFKQTGSSIRQTIIEEIGSLIKIQIKASFNSLELNVLRKVTATINIKAIIPIAII